MDTSIANAQKQELLRYQDGTISRYHARASLIVRPDEEVQRAAANAPFGDLAHHAAELEAMLREDPQKVQDHIARQLEEFLRNMWPMLEEDQVGFPVSFSLHEEDDPAEVEQLSETIERNRELGLIQQADSELPKVLRAFSEARGILRYLRKKGLLLPHTILPDSQLPWFTVTAPVWYVGGQHRFSFDTQSPDPYPDDFVQYMAKRLGSQRLADWFQMWNRRSRPFSDYKGDVIPNGLLGVMSEAVQVFDYVAIATPYHDVASKEWTDPSWKRLIDPYLLGFSEKIPSFFFFLGRWSNTGIFPLAAEMMAHTMGYLKEHREQLAGFGLNPYWAILELQGNGIFDDAGNRLQSRANEALIAFEEQRFYAWLTEGRS